MLPHLFVEPKNQHFLHARCIECGGMRTDAIHTVEKMNLTQIATAILATSVRIATIVRDGNSSENIEYFDLVNRLDSLKNGLVNAIMLLKS